MKALITGASSGIGKEIARYLAELGYDLILVSRSTDKLNKLKEELSNVNVRVITLDFSRESDSLDLYEHIKNENEQIDFLVNNAGFGAYGKFLDVPLERELELIHTNVSTVHILTKLFLKDMAERNSGYILNVGSAAGFLAGPTFASYYASKNYVVRLTQAIHEEMRRDNKNVKVSPKNSIQKIYSATKRKFFRHPYPICLLMTIHSIISRQLKPTTSGLIRKMM